MIHLGLMKLIERKLIVLFLTEATQVSRRAPYEGALPIPYSITLGTVHDVAAL